MTQAKPNPPAPTVSHLFGEITWLLTQSPLHRHLKLADLEWLVMPALLSRQLYIFRDGDNTIGVALWGKLSAEAEKKLDKPLMEGKSRLAPEDWTSGENIWLIDLVAPFANEQNKQREIMMADLLAGPLKGQAFKLHRTDPKTGKRSVVTIEKDTGEKLTAAIRNAAEAAGDQKVH